MPVRYTLTGSLLRLDLEGQYEPKDIIEQFLAGLADPTCPPQVGLMLDVTRSESLEARAPHEIRHVAEFLGPYVDRIRGRCAVVATKDIHFGLSSMGGAYTENVGVETAVFRGSESAIKWLGV